VNVGGIFINGPDGGNYTVTQPTSLTASISKATASVTPLAAAKTYGAPDPVLLGNLSGFVGSDNITATHSRTAGETVAGSPYKISATLSPAAALDNYDITYGTAALTITKATASVTPNTATKVFGTPDPPLTGTLSGFLPADNVTAAYARTTGETVAGSPYTISATLSPLGVLPNYKVTYNTANFTITTNTSTTVLATSSASSVFGQSVTFTATVTGSGGTPTGTITFKDGTTSLGTGTLNGSGVATLSTSALTVGTHSIKAEYGGDANFAGSASNVLSQIVNAPRYTLTVNGIHGSVAKAPDQTDYASGDLVTLTASAEAGYHFVNWSGDVTGTTNPVSVTMDANKNITANFVGNSAPQVEAISAPLDPVLINTEISASASLTDSDPGDTHTAIWSWGDGLNTPGLVTANVVTGTHMYAAAGVYTIKLTVTDGYGASGENSFQYIVVNNPDAGSVTGNGWISSPAGAYVGDPTETGKIKIGFVAKYRGRRDELEGKAEFNLKSEKMKFKCTAYDWLVISGDLAVAQGVGTINGSGNYGFLIVATDGKISGDKIDRFRLKIWDKNNSNSVVYDNQPGAKDTDRPTAVLGGGKIDIHEPKDGHESKDGTSTLSAGTSVPQEILDKIAIAPPTEYELHNAYPNPFNPSTTIKFDLPEASKVRLVVYDMLGREVAVLADGERPAGQYNIRFDASRLSSGMYVYRLQTSNYTQTKKVVLMK
jgi:hypothetical protein